MKSFKLFLCAMVAMLAMAGCDDKNKKSVSVDSLVIDPSELMLAKDQSKTLIADIYPAEAKSEVVEWVSIDESIVKIDATGKVTGISAGKTKIMAQVGGKRAFCAVTVEAIEFDITQKDVAVGELVVITPKILSDKAKEYTIEWSSSDDKIAVVEEGWVQTLKAGSVVITATAGDMKAECRINVRGYEVPQGVGDFFYSDGTYSSELDPNKTPIGVVFWVGDPTASDATLKKDHPGCTHGLVVGLSEARSTYFADDEASHGFTNSFGGSISEWVEVNISENQKPYGTNYENVLPYQIRGYNNTLALKDFNADPRNSAWLLQPIVALENYAAQNALPQNTSGWFFPSLKELSLMCTGIYDGPLADLGGFLNSNGVFLNTKIEQIEGATPLFTIDEQGYSLYWSSTEVWDNEMMWRIMSRLNMARGNLGTDINSGENFVRFIFAF